MIEISHRCNTIKGKIGNRITDGHMDNVGVFKEVLLVRNFL